jgi:PhzF family phenazine biosynthesis protein
MHAELHLVDAFTGTPFRGNTAAVCILREPADSTWMQQVATELKHSETAFLNKVQGGWNIRWFTPLQEVDLCGHATLASAFVLWNSGKEKPGARISFESLSGTLTAEKDGGWINLDFPAEPVTAAVPVPGLDRALGVEPVFTGRNRFDILAELSSADEVCNLDPDISALAAIPARGIMVTAASDLPQYDFVSRFFAPSVGVAEDPVTGSAHCCLGPYWGEKQKKTDLTGFQCSARGGLVHVTLKSGRVILGGNAVPIFSGILLI